MTQHPFGDTLRNSRKSSGLTRAQLAVRAGLSAHALASYEQGVRSPASPSIVRRIAAALGCDVSPMLRAAGFSVRGRVPYEMVTTMRELLAEGETHPWPCLINNEHLEVVAANVTARLLAGFDVAAPEEPGSKHLLRLALDPRMRPRIANLDEVLVRLAGIMKSDRINLAGSAEGPRFPHAVSAWLATVDAATVAWLFGLWATAQPWSVGRRLTFQTRWSVEDGPTLSFDCIISPWSMLLGAWAFDWHAADGTTLEWLARLGELQPPPAVRSGWGARMEERRKAHGLSRAALGRVAGVSANAIYQWERERRRPGISGLERLVRDMPMDGTTAGMITDALGYDPIPSAAHRYLAGEIVPGRPDLETLEVLTIDEDAIRESTSEHRWPSLVLGSGGVVAASNAAARRLFDLGDSRDTSTMAALVGSRRFVEACSNWDECAPVLVGHPLRLTRYVSPQASDPAEALRRAGADSGLITRFTRALASDRKPAAIRAYVPLVWQSSGATTLSFRCLVGQWNIWDPYVAIDLHPADRATWEWMSAGGD